MHLKMSQSMETVTRTLFLTQVCSRGQDRLSRLFHGHVEEEARSLPNHSGVLGLSFPHLKDCISPMGNCNFIFSFLLQQNTCKNLIDRQSICGIQRSSAPAANPSAHLPVPSLGIVSLSLGAHQAASQRGWKHPGKKKKKQKTELLPVVLQL